MTEEERPAERTDRVSPVCSGSHTSRPDKRTQSITIPNQYATVTTLMLANTAKKHSDVTIKKKQIAPWDLRFIAFSDASFASKAKPESYAGMIILATHKDIAQNKSCVINPLYWGTKKQKFSELWQARCLQKHLRYPPLLINWLGYECIGYGCSTQPFTGKNPETIHTLP